VAFQIEFSKKATKFLNKLDDNTFNRIIEKIEKLSENPFPHDAKRVVGRKEKIFRIRSGNHRILYMVINDQLVVLIVDIDKRSKVYT